MKTSRLTIAHEIRQIAEHMENGCGNHGCVIRKPGGMGTNAPCHCSPRRFVKYLLDAAVLAESVGRNWPKEGEM